MTFEVNAKFTFTGTFTIEAETTAMAKKAIFERYSLQGTHVVAPLVEGIDLKFSGNPEMSLGKVHKATAQETETSQQPVEA